MKSICLVKTNFNNRYENSHDYVDIIFWIEYFKRKDNYKFHVFCQKFDSFKDDKKIKMFNTKNHSNKFITLILELLRLLSIPKFDIYLFQAYSEINIVLWYFLCFFRKKKIILIATNNITQERLNKLINKLLYKIISKLRAVIYVHSKSEKLILSEYYPPYLIKIKKYHLWSEVLGITHFKNDNSNNIFYPGPPKIDKPIYYFENFFNSNTKFFKKFNYFLLNTKAKTFNLVFDSHIEISNLNYQNISGYFNSSNYIFLPHNKSFEGKLSGNLIDAIDFGIIIISNTINPVIEYFDEYGQLGILIDYDSEYKTDLAEKLQNLDIKKIKSNLAKARIDHTMDRIFNQLDEEF